MSRMLGMARSHVILLAAFGAVIAVLGAAALALRAMATASPPGAATERTAGAAPRVTPGFAVACEIIGPTGGPGDNCQWIVAELVRRAPLDRADGTVADAVLRGVQQALANRRLSGRGGRCEITEPGGPCRWEPDPFTVSDVEGMRQALFAAGFRDFIVRLARPGDIAPVGAAVYGVGAGPACVLGLESDGIAGDTAFVAGRLPDGSCLTP